MPAFPSLTCPHCQSRLRLRPAEYGALQSKQVTCPSCTHKFTYDDAVTAGRPVGGTPQVHGDQSAATQINSPVPLYRYKTKDGVSDPVDIAGLRTLAVSGRLSPYDHVMRDGQADWYLASTIIPSFQPSTAAPEPASPAQATRRSVERKRPPSAMASSGTWMIRFAWTIVGICVAVFGTRYASDAYSVFHFRSILSGQDVSSVLAIERNAHWLDWYLPRIPSLLRKTPSVMVKHATLADGYWHYEVKTRTGDIISFVHSAGTGDQSAQSLSTLWTRSMHAEGHSRPDWKDRPNAIRAVHLSIRDPAGTTWTVGGPGYEIDATQILCLAAMLGSSSYRGDVRVLMECDRGTFPYAFAFSTITCKLGVNDALALSCDQDARKRAFASEILLSTLPRPSAGAGTFDAVAYEAALRSLSEPVSIAEKRLRYEQLRQ